MKIWKWIELLPLHHPPHTPFYHLPSTAEGLLINQRTAGHPRSTLQVAALTAHTFKCILTSLLKAINILPFRQQPSFHANTTMSIDSCIQIGPQSGCHLITRQGCNPPCHLYPLETNFNQTLQPYQHFFFPSLIFKIAGQSVRHQSKLLSEISNTLPCGPP